MSEQPGHGSAGTPSTSGHGFSAISAGAAHAREEGEGTSGLDGTGLAPGSGDEPRTTAFAHPVPAQAGRDGRRTSELGRFDWFAELDDFGRGNGATHKLAPNADLAGYRRAACGRPRRGGRSERLRPGGGRERGRCADRQPQAPLVAAEWLAARSLAARCWLAARCSLAAWFGWMQVWRRAASQRAQRRPTRAPPVAAGQMAAGQMAADEQAGAAGSCAAGGWASPRSCSQSPARCSAASSAASSPCTARDGLVRLQLQPGLGTAGADQPPGQLGGRDRRQGHARRGHDQGQRQRGHRIRLPDPAAATSSPTTTS